MLGQESTHRFNSWTSCFCSWHGRLTNRTEILQGMLCRTMVQHLSRSQQCQTVKQLKYGITGLMDGKYDGSSSSWEPEIETKHLLSTPHFEFQEDSPRVSKSKTNNLATSEGLDQVKPSLPSLSLCQMLPARLSRQHPSLQETITAVQVAKVRCSLQAAKPEATAVYKPSLNGFYTRCQPD